MRKLLFTLVMCLLLIIAVAFIVKGIAFNNFEIYGINQIKEKNAEIDEKVDELDNLTKIKYPKAENDVKTASLEMKKAKEEYEEQATLLGNSKYYVQTEEYKLEFLWTKLGNYADEEDVDIKIDVTNSQISGRYNLNFTVTGKYTDVTQFIYDIENDSKLGFKIEDFSMISGVVGTFSCKDIKIDLKEKSSDTDKNQNATNNGNTTTKGNTTTNTVNATTSSGTNVTVNDNTTVY